MEILLRTLDLFLHLDDHLHYLRLNFGGWTHAIIFLVIFCETGPVVTPFLPGDPLPFADPDADPCRDEALIARASAPSRSGNPVLKFFTPVQPFDRIGARWLPDFALANR